MKYVKINVSLAIRERLSQLSKKLNLPMTTILEILFKDLDNVVEKLLTIYVKLRKFDISLSDVEVKLSIKDPKIRKILEILEYPIIGDATEEITQSESIKCLDLVRCLEQKSCKCFKFKGSTYVIINTTLLKVSEFCEEIPNLYLLEIDLTNSELINNYLSKCRCFGYEAWWRWYPYNSIIPDDEKQLLELLWVRNDVNCSIFQNPESWYRSQIRQQYLGGKLVLPTYQWLDKVKTFENEILTKCQEYFGLSKSKVLSKFRYIRKDVGTIIQLLKI